MSEQKNIGEIVTDEQKRRKIINLIIKEMSHITSNKLSIETSLSYAQYQLEKFKDEYTGDREQNSELIPIQERKIKDFEAIRDVLGDEIKLLEEIKQDLEE